MTESNWERSQRRFLRRVQVALCAGIPLLVVAGIIYINNRDVLRDSTADSTKPEKKSESVVQIADTGMMHKNAEPVAVQVKKVHPLSIQLPPVSCRVSDRGDLRILIALEVFYDDGDMTQEILLRQKEMNVMVQRVFANRVLADIRKERTTNEILDAINSIFDRKTLNSIQFRKFQIEKVETP